MHDIFNQFAPRVYWSERFQNLLIFNPATLYMFATIEGHTRKKVCVNEKYFKKEYQLTYIGQL